MITPSPCRGSVPFTTRNALAVALMVLTIGAAPLNAAGPAPQSHPEKPYALIYGTVYGPDDRPMYGVKVKIRRANEKKARWEHYSDHAGEFAQRVPAGKADYAVRADLKGYKSQQYKSLQAGPELTVHIENDERTDISLHLKQ